MSETGIRLSASTLGSLGASVVVPAYERGRLRTGIAHIGVGAFHRAHQAVYLDEVLKAGGTEWGECGVGLLPGDARMRDALRGQDYLYTVLTRDEEVRKARVVGSIMDFIQATENQEGALERLAAPEIRIVSLTITEGGYYLDEGTGELWAEHPVVQRDLENPTAPEGVLGVLAEGLARRRARGIAPFTVMSCDNLPGNGAVTKRALLGFAELREPRLRAWIESNVAFPNGMVDGITPVTTDADRAQLRAEFGIEDAWPVVTEPFSQWVLEDEFPQGRPEWERAGVQFVHDVGGYEMMKLRLLNAGHLALAYLAALRGIALVDVATHDGLLRPFLTQFLDQVTPVIPHLEGVDVEEYKRMLVHRFGNPEIGDQISRICSEGSAKLPKFLLPSVRELMAKGLPWGHLALTVAAWCVHLRGVDERGGAFAVMDRDKEELVRVVGSGAPFPDSLLRLRLIFGELGERAEFVDAVRGWVRGLEERGATAVVRGVVG